MGRPPNSKIAHRAYEIIKQHPGISSTELKTKLGLRDAGVIHNILASCEANGLLISEDEKVVENKSAAKKKNVRPFKVISIFFPWRIEDSE